MFGSAKQLIMEGDNLLYHYTSAKSLIKILKHMRLRLSKFDKLNDLNEVDMCCGENEITTIRLKQYIKDNCRLISFSCNELNGNRVIKNAINLPRMWAHYANNNQGACIVINKEKFLKKNEKILNGKGMFADIFPVNYNKTLTVCDINCREDEFESFVKENIELLLCQKNFDWEGEMEHRFIYFDSNLSKKKRRKTIYLSILDSIEWICLGRHFVDNEEQIKHLVDVINNPNNKCCGLIDGFNLCTILTQPWGYSPSLLHLESRFNGKYKIPTKSN